MTRSPPEAALSASPPTAVPTSSEEDDCLRLSPGVELLGKCVGSGFKETTYLLRRGDGQVMQVSQLLYRLSESLDGSRDAREIASRMTESAGRHLTADNVSLLLDKLRPLGLIDGPGMHEVRLRRHEPLLGLRFRLGVLPPALVHLATTALLPLFWPVIVLLVVIGFIAFDLWLFGLFEVSSQLQYVAAEPSILLLVVGLALAAAAFHELGHATACRYGGANPGEIGLGIYLVWPVLYNDITDTYRLPKRDRLRADLGGLYFNMVFILVLGGAYLVTDLEPLLLAIYLQHIQASVQLIPFLRFDGYHILSDLVGVPDLFGRVKPILVSLIPGRAAHPRARELKAWVRAVVTVWVVATLVVLSVHLAIVIGRAPLFVGLALNALGVHVDTLVAATREGAVAAVAGALIQVMGLALPLLGITLSVALMLTRVGHLVQRVGRNRRGRRDAPTPAATGASGLAVAEDPKEAVGLGALGGHDRAGELCAVLTGALEAIARIRVVAEEDAAAVREQAERQAIQVRDEAAALLEDARGLALRHLDDSRRQILAAMECGRRASERLDAEQAALEQRYSRAAATLEAEANS